MWTQNIYHITLFNRFMPVTVRRGTILLDIYLWQKVISDIISMRNVHQNKTEISPSNISLTYVIFLSYFQYSCWSWRQCLKWLLSMIGLTTSHLECTHSLKTQKPKSLHRIIVSGWEGRFPKPKRHTNLLSKVNRNITLLSIVIKLCCKYRDRVYVLDMDVLTRVSLVANLANTKWCKTFLFKYWNPGKWVSHLRVLSANFQMNTKMIGRVEIYLENVVLVLWIKVSSALEGLIVWLWNLLDLYVIASITTTICSLLNTQLPISH